MVIVLSVVVSKVAWWVTSLNYALHQKSHCTQLSVMQIGLRETKHPEKYDNEREKYDNCGLAASYLGARYLLVLVFSSLGVSIDCHRGDVFSVPFHILSA